MAAETQDDSEIVRIEEGVNALIDQLRRTDPKMASDLETAIAAERALRKERERLTETLSNGDTGTPQVLQPFSPNLEATMLKNIAVVRPEDLDRIARATTSRENLRKVAQAKNLLPETIVFLVAKPDIEVLKNLACNPTANTEAIKDGIIATAETNGFFDEMGDLYFNLVRAQGSRISQASLTKIAKFAIREYSTAPHGKSYNILGAIIPRADLPVEIRREFNDKKYNNVKIGHGIVS